MQPSLASGIWPAATLLLHSGYVLAAGAALIAALAITAASVCLTRKHLTWGVYLDMPVALISQQAPGTGTRTLRITLTGEPGNSAGRDPAGERDRAGEDEAWLVILRITNSGFAPIRGEHFSTPLAFEFPGREVRGIQISPGQAIRTRAGLPASRTRPVPAVHTPAGRVQLSGDFLLRRGDSCSLMAVLQGRPAAPSRRIKRDGCLAGGTITPEASGDPVGRWLAPGLCAAISGGRTLLLGLVPGPGG